MICLLPVKKVCIGHAREGKGCQARCASLPGCHKSRQDFHDEDPRRAPNISEQSIVACDDTIWSNKRGDKNPVLSGPIILLLYHIIIPASVSRIRACAW